MASVTESIISRVAAALINVSDAGARVYRHRLDSFEESELPALNVNRNEDASDPLGSNGDRVLVNFEVECLALGANWETATDALHMQVHTALLADTPLATLGRGLRYLGSVSEGASADQGVGKLTARYQMQVFIRPSDLTRAIS